MAALRARPLELGYCIATAIEPPRYTVSPCSSSSTVMCLVAVSVLADLSSEFGRLLIYVAPGRG